jgi:hypothetical protein
VHDEPTPSDEAFLDEALLWLNDRLGKSVTVLIALHTGDTDVSVLEAAGELRHWTEGRAAVRAASRDDVAGMYDVGGDATLDLTHVRPLHIATWPDEDDHLVVRIDESTTLQVVVHDDY